MQYDPIKDKLGVLFGRHPWLQLLFFKLIDVLLLRAWHVHRAMRVFLKDKPMPVRILDAGTGFGQYAWFAARTFDCAEIVAVDIKSTYLQRARTLFARRAPKITVAYDDLTMLSVPGPFDGILAVDVLEHIEDDRRVLAHFARVLAPGGVVIINTPSDMGGSESSAEDTQGFVDEHVRDGYNKAALEDKIRASGLMIVASRYTYGTFGALAWQMLMKVPMRLLNRAWALGLLLPFYYVVTMPLGLVLHLVDVRRANARGSGLLVVARKP